MMALRLDTDLAPALAMLLLSLPRFAAARTTCHRNIVLRNLFLVRKYYYVSISSGLLQHMRRP